jgi:osmotically-inducible protein OsmY
VGVHRVRNRIKVRPVRFYSADDLEERLRGALLRDPYVQSYDISVIVDGRIAKLYGTVDSYFEKSQAEYVAERVRGVATVLNNLVVRQDNVPLTYDPYLDSYPAPRYSWYDYDPVPTYRADREIAEDIRDELWWSPFVDSDDVTVTVDAGTATLSGQVDSWSEWRAASENAWEGGAIWVVNNLEVASSGQG